ncbi:hypothetical protein LTR17_020906 [Elasticomyces elasticus]|nr:hypothetical protein LTR17_020906 [Elasticomyces elasticus]
MTSGQEVFGTRRCRNSYGVAVRVLYDPKRHKGLPFVTDPNTKRQWVENMVDWVIKQGEEINATEGLRKPYGIILREADHNVQRHARIVMSALPVSQLPSRTTDAGCREVILVKYRLTSNDMKLTKYPVWKFKKSFWKADFFFVVKSGPADIKFQILGQNGILSSDHDSMDVEYLDPVEVKNSSNMRHVSVQQMTLRPASQTPTSY